MNYSILIRPIIGAVIGYVTNWIAVKMMFRPLQPVKIGKWTIPFTPGIIPKNKERIANSIGNVISENLLTEQVLAENLLSNEVKKIIENRAFQMIEDLKENNQTIEHVANGMMDRTSYEMAIAYVIDTLSASIYDSVKDANLGDIITVQIEKAAREKINGSIMGMFGGNALISRLSDEVRNKINEYILQNGYTFVEEMVEREINKITSTKISDIMFKIESSEIDLVSIIMKIYQKIVLEKLSNILRTINISKIVANKINAMDMLELEKMILEVMKKELNALVNLGAIIGFILGLLNLLF